MITGRGTLLRCVKVVAVGWMVFDFKNFAKRFEKRTGTFAWLCIYDSLGDNVHDEKQLFLLQANFRYHIYNSSTPVIQKE